MQWAEQRIPPLFAMRQARRAHANINRTSPYEAMNSRHMFNYALTHSNQSVNKICRQNSHGEANGKLMLATEDAKTWEEMQVSLTHVYFHFLVFSMLTIVILMCCK